MLIAINHIQIDIICLQGASDSHRCYSVRSFGGHETKNKKYFWLLIEYLRNKSAFDIYFSI